MILREGSICEGHPEYLDGTLTNGTTVVDNGVDLDHGPRCGPFRVRTS